MSYRYELSPKAFQDIRSVILWLADRSLQGSQTWSAALYEALDELTLRPLTFPKLPVARRQSVELRTLSFRTRKGGNYQLIYIVDGDIVRVLRVRGPGQPPVRRRDLP